jgi:Carbamoyltransferase N-terminus
MNILGISAHYHDSAAALVVDGVPVCAIQEERLSRHKGDSAFPLLAIESCLQRAGVELFNVLITRNLLILCTPRRPKKATLPIPLYVYCTKILSSSCCADSRSLCEYHPVVLHLAITNERN